MRPMARALEQEGFSTLIIPYPSARKPVRELAALVRQEVEKIAGDEPVHFITHSLGGIIVRELLAGELPWETGRVIMLAPPSQGSEIVDWSKNHPVLRKVLGPAGQALGSDGIPGELPALPAELKAAAIMGRRSSIPFFRKLLGPENDGIVSADKGRMEGLCGFTVIDADHTFIQMHPEAIRLCLDFLKTGDWPD